MANPWRGEAPISIGGKDRVLRFDANDIADLEDVLGGRSVLGILRKGEADAYSFLRAAISVGLRRDTKVTPKQVGRWLSDEHNISVFTGAVIRALLLAIKGPDFQKRADELDKDDEDEDEDELDEESDEQEADDADPPTSEAGTGSPASAPQPE